MALAAASGRSESQVVEQALRAYLRSSHVGFAADGLRQLMYRVSHRVTLDDDAARDLAVAEVRAVRDGHRPTSE